MSDPIVTRRLSEALQILKTDPTGFVGAHQLWVYLQRSINLTTRLLVVAALTVWARRLFETFLADAHPPRHDTRLPSRAVRIHCEYWRITGVGDPRPPSLN